MAKRKVKFYKDDLVEEVHKHIGGKRSDAEKAVSLVFESIVARVDNGEQVSIAGFGSFLKKGYKARLGRNPRTGDSVEVPAMFRVRFTPALGFKRVINQAK